MSRDKNTGRGSSAGREGRSSSTTQAGIIGAANLGIYAGDRITTSKANQMAIHNYNLLENALKVSDHEKMKLFSDRLKAWRDAYLQATEKEGRTRSVYLLDHIDKILKEAS